MAWKDNLRGTQAQWQLIDDFFDLHDKKEWKRQYFMPRPHAEEGTLLVFNQEMYNWLASICEVDFVKEFVSSRVIEKPQKRKKEK